MFTGDQEKVRKVNRSLILNTLRLHAPVSRAQVANITGLTRGTVSNIVNSLIEEGLVVSNDLILAELLPPLLVRRQSKLVSLLRELPRLKLAIDWEGLVADQTSCLRNGINKVGIPDLIIAQNARQHQVALFTGDKHFRLLAGHVGLQLF